MLVLTRNDREGILITLPDGKEFQVFVERGKLGCHRLLVDAPREIQVSRISRNGHIQCRKKGITGSGKSSLSRASR